MFCEYTDGYRHDISSNYDNMEGGDEESDSDMEAIEAALYAQIHFQMQDNCPSSDQPFSVQTFTENSEPVAEDVIKSNNFSSLPTTVCRDLNSFQKKVNTELNSYDITDLSTSSPTKFRKSDVNGDDIDTISSSSDVSSDCMILDEAMPNMGDIVVHVDQSQRSILLGNIPREDEAVTDQPGGQEADKWQISEMDKMAGSSSPALKRYYSPITVRCQNCRNIGHISNVCPKPKKSQICHLCGVTGHFFRKCPQSICYNCESPGHTSKECNQPRKSSRGTCHRCLMPGHTQNVCPDIWRQFHLTTSVGPVERTKMKENKKKYCCNCASRKHFGFECLEERMERHVRGSYPFIVSYSYVHRDGNQGSKSTKTTDKTETKKKNPSKKEKHLKSDMNKDRGSKNWNNMLAQQASKQSAYGRDVGTKKRKYSNVAEPEYTQDHRKKLKKDKKKSQLNENSHGQYKKDIYHSNTQHRKDKKYTSPRGFRTSYKF